MATAYKADNYYTDPMPEASVSGVVLVRPFVFTIPVALVINDTIALMPLLGASLPGFTLIGFQIDVPDNDSGTSEVLEVGDGTAANRFITTTQMGTLGQVAGRAGSFVPVGGGGSNTVAAGIAYGVLPLTYTADDNLLVTVQTAPGTGTTGGQFRGFGLYTQLGVTSV